MAEAGTPVPGAANSCAEYAPEPSPETKQKDVFWFALEESQPLFCFAGIWTEFRGRSRHQVEADAGPSPRLRFSYTFPTASSSRSIRRRCL